MKVRGDAEREHQQRAVALAQRARNRASKACWNRMSGLRDRRVAAVLPAASALRA